MAVLTKSYTGSNSKSSPQRRPLLPQNYAAIVWLRMQTSSFPLQEWVSRPSQHRAYSVTRQTPKISGVLIVQIVLAALALSGCGGSSDVPIVPPVGVTPPVVVPRAWGAPQVSANAFSDSTTQGANVSAQLDNCGGVVLVGLGSDGWSAQRYSPATGWQAPNLLTPATGLDVQFIAAGNVPHVFYRDAVSWRQSSLDCETNRWTSSDAFPVEFSYSATLTSTALYVHFCKTFDEQILAASANGNGSAVVLRERAGTATQTASWSAPELASVRRNLLPGPPMKSCCEPSHCAHEMRTLHLSASKVMQVRRVPADTSSRQGFV